MTYTPVSSAELASWTPMMRQYFEIKQRCPDHILFFRMGDFYEIFGDDAIEVAPKLELVLTSREKGDKTKIPFCGVPHHSSQNYISKLLRHHYKIAIADQLEDPSSGKGLLKRDITRMLTPGCIDEPQDMDAQEPNYLCAVLESPDTHMFHGVLADVSTGELRVGSFPSFEGFKEYVERCQPKEILCRKFWQPELTQLLSHYRTSRSCVFSSLPEACLRHEAEQEALLHQVLGDASLEAQPCGLQHKDSRAVLAALLSYIQTLGLSLKPFLFVRPLYEPKTMSLGEVVIRDLELFQTVRHQSRKGSLFAVINHTLSPMGARLLRWNLANPLLEASDILERQQAVSELLALGSDTLHQLRQCMMGTCDLERFLSKLSAGSIRPKELAAVRQGLSHIRHMARFVTEHTLESPLLRRFGDLADLESILGILSQALTQEPSDLGEGCHVFAPGFDATLDEHNALAVHGFEQVEAYQERLRAESRISGLKIKSHQSFGLLIEVTKSHLGKVPSYFIKRQSMVGCERYITPELKDLEGKLASAKECAVEEERRLYNALVTQLACYYKTLKEAAEHSALCDMLQSFAWLAHKEGYVRAHISKDTLWICDGRHPVVETVVGKTQFVANTVHLQHPMKQMLITGPNMGGKSTVMRQTALCALLNQVGSFVPARSASLPIFDHMFTRVGASDDLYQGLSTFMVEMKEAAGILRQATEHSLVILDEVGRGTSTEDGLALGAAIFEHLTTHTRSWTLFATHFHELIPIVSSWPSVALCQTKVLQCDGEITFSHRLESGACSSSFGFEVAKLAGVPETVLNRAHTFAIQQACPQALAPAVQASVGVTPQDELLEQFQGRLGRVNIRKTTPLQALNILDELQHMLRTPFVHAKGPLFDELQS